MHQPFPGTSSAPEPARGKPPASVVKAAWAMRAGMIASLAGIVLNLLSLKSIGSAIRHLEPHVTATQLTVDQRMAVGETIAAGLLSAALWLWMAQSCTAGKSWARTLSTILFGVFTVLQAAALGAGFGAGQIYSIVVWLIGLTAIVFLWHPTSTPHFR